jgi:hypothetical protein
MKKHLPRTVATHSITQISHFPPLIMVIRIQNGTLEHYTSYRSADIQACVYALRELQHNASNCPLNAIREKYRQEKV